MRKLWHSFADSSFANYIDRYFRVGRHRPNMVWAENYHGPYGVQFEVCA